MQSSLVTNNVAMGGLTFATSGVSYTVHGLSGSGNIALTAVSGGSLTLNVNGAGSTTYSGLSAAAGH